MPPKASTNPPHHHTGAPSKSNTMRMKPYTATLVMTPLIKADMWLGVGPGAQVKRKPFILNALFATEAIAAGTELRMDYQYTEGMIKKQFA